jgi:hypothetical protein
MPSVTSSCCQTYELVSVFGVDGLDVWSLICIAAVLRLIKLYAVIARRSSSTRHVLFCGIVSRECVCMTFRLQNLNHILVVRQRMLHLGCCFTLLQCSYMKSLLPAQPLL